MAERRQTSGRGTQRQTSGRAGRGRGPSSRGASRTGPTARPAGRATARGGLTQKVKPDDALAEVVGSAPQPRTELVKRFWTYVRSRGLQDKKDRRKINADKKLQPLFGRKKQVTMFEVPKLINQHAR